MTLEIQAPLEAAFQELDRADLRLDEFAVRDSLARIAVGIEHPTAAQRKGNLALLGALEFQRRRHNVRPTWDMYWQPLSEIVDEAGTVHISPPVDQVDDEIIQEWSRRAGAARHPLLRARYSDLAWEITRFRRGELTERPDAGMARAACDGYLDTVEGHLNAEEFFPWVYIDRALELALSIKDADRLQRAKRVLFAYQADCEARGPDYAFLRFDEIAWTRKRALALTNEDQAIVVDALERQLALCSNIEVPERFDPHRALSAADCLARWREYSGQKAEGLRAALTAGAAFEAAAARASGLTATAWLSDQAARYRQLGQVDAVARVERAIRDRSGEVQGEMRRISVPLGVTREQVDAWADRVAGDTFEAGINNFAAEGVVRKESAEQSVIKISARAPLSAHMTIMITGRDGFTRATVGPIDQDLDGRTVHHAAQHLSQGAPFLNLAWERLKEKHGVNLEGLLGWLSQCPFLPSGRMNFIREGLAAWFAGDMVKAIHVLVPQVEAALRDLLAALGGVVHRQEADGSFRVISLGEVLKHRLFREEVPADIRFHLEVLYQDPRGLNVRNELAHGIAAFELFDLGVANMVVHSVILIGTIRVQRAAPE